MPDAHRRQEDEEEVLKHDLKMILTSSTSTKRPALHPRPDDVPTDAEVRAGTSVKGDDGGLINEVLR